MHRTLVGLRTSKEAPMPPDLTIVPETEAIPSAIPTMLYARNSDKEIFVRCVDVHGEDRLLPLNTLVSLIAKEVQHNVVEQIRLATGAKLI
jgi:hypothetical protein